MWLWCNTIRWYRGTLFKERSGNRVKNQIRLRSTLLSCQMKINYSIICILYGVLCSYLSSRDPLTRWWNDRQETKKTYQNNGGSCIGSGTGCLTKMGQWQWWGGGGGGQGWWRGGVRMGFHLFPLTTPFRCSLDWCWLVHPWRTMTTNIIRC